SVLVRELEGQLGFRLFDRTTRKVALTEFGTKFLPIADRSLLELEAAASVIGRAASVANRRIAIGATPLIASKLLPSVISDYAAHSPDMKIVLHDGDRSRVVAMALSGEIDVGLGCFLQPVSGVRRTPLFRFSLMVIEPAAQPASGPPRCLRWKDIVGWRLIGAPPHNPIQQLIDRSLQRFGRREPPDMVFDYFETQIAMVEAGVGCAVIPTFAIPACRRHRIAMHPLTDPMVPIELCQIAGRGRKQPPGFEDFTRFLKSYIAEWAEPWSPKVA
ncbi:MAG TPA: LysR substrate-binding domain-containing protein, partial [Burkholderiales bacterium]|nr:LysR substrate-binding domain-containing protein [Burkholderiales bacterium]